MKSEFKVGDVVVLKSGGPRMTITKMEVTFDADVSRVEWIWEGELRIAAFPVECLKKVRSGK
jgi:uncharacterized protein YodC (DUF2158 family)